MVSVVWHKDERVHKSIKKGNKGVNFPNTNLKLHNELNHTGINHKVNTSGSYYISGASCSLIMNLLIWWNFSFCCNKICL